ncbi:PREDICTED: basic proline-rich protein-like [Lipotes vexillifer]|uniref:Basic proline-rich protein-like n=1 Tax=Lipotes vexillifer TaxID=118797 RepID=A0A340X3J3_LIPVE|nr:PREDICTED: basic proline-rich protein-like [Lipotes vexillifer]
MVKKKPGREDSPEGERPVNARGHGSRQKFQTGFEAPPRNASYPRCSLSEAHSLLGLRPNVPACAPPTPPRRLRGRVLTLRRRKTFSVLAPVGGGYADPERPPDIDRPPDPGASTHGPRWAALVFASIKGMVTAFRPGGVAPRGGHLGLHRKSLPPPGSRQDPPVNKTPLFELGPLSQAPQHSTPQAHLLPHLAAVFRLGLGCLPALVSCWGEQLSPPGLAPGPQSLTGVEEPGGLGGGLSRLSAPMIDEGLNFPFPPQAMAPPSGLGAGFRTRHGLEAQPGIGGVVKPQKSGFTNGNGLGVRAFPGSATQPGYGNGLGAGDFPGPGAQAGPTAQNVQGPGIGGSVKPQKPGQGMGHGLGAQPGFGTGNGAQPGLGGLKSQKPGPAAQNGYVAGFGASVRPQKPRFGNSYGLGAQPGSAVPIGYGPGIAEAMKPQKPVYRNGLGVGAFPGEGTQPGLGGGLSPPKPGYMPGNGLQLPPGLGGGLKPQKPGYQPLNGYRPGAELGFGGGLKPQKVAIMYYALDHSGGQSQGDSPSQVTLAPPVLPPPHSNQPLSHRCPTGFGYRNGGLGARVFPETHAQPGFPGTDGFWNGPYGQLRPELGPGPLGGPEVKAVRGHLLEKQGLRGLCARGPGAAVVAKLASRLPRSRSHPRLARARVHSRPAPPPPPPSALALAELPPLPALPLRPKPLAPWGPGAHVALPDLPPEAWSSAPPAAALALQDLPRLPAPTPPPSHLPLPPLPETVVAATPGPVGARGRPPLNAEPPPQPLPPLPARPSPFNLHAPPAPLDPWLLPAFPPPLPLPPPPPHFFL